MITDSKTISLGSGVKQILERWSNFEAAQALLSRLAEPGQSNSPAKVIATGLSGSSSSMLLSWLATSQGRPLLAVTESATAAQDLYEDLLFLMDDGKVGFYPARQILPYDFSAPVGEIMGQRISTLSGLQGGRLHVVVCPIRALMEPTLTPAQLAESSLRLSCGDSIDLDEFTARLVKLGFKRVPLVEEVGDFALRGGLVDFFTPGAESPVRVELFGDEIETIRQFEVSTQRTIARIDNVEILPKREISITEETLEQYLAKLPEDDSDYVRARYLNDPELPGLEWLAVLFGLPQGRLLDFFPNDGLLVTFSEGSLKEEAKAVIDEAIVLRERLSGRISSLPAPDEYYLSLNTVSKQLTSRQSVDIVPFKGGGKEIINFDCKEHPSFGSRLDLLAAALDDFENSGVKYVIATDTQGQAERLGELIEEKGGGESIPPIEVANLKGGFVCQSGRFALLTDHEIFGRYHRRVRKKKFREGVAIQDYANLTQGDYVVHTDHGIARFLGLETLSVDGRNRDCLSLAYAEKDRLYVPIEEFNRVSRYSGKDGAPTLTRLGGAGWERTRQKTKKAIADMAEELLELYAQRKKATGFAFGEDTVWMKQLEASFPFEETADQLRAINEVRIDMQLEKPMDRLICGDVGFGKTEVAVRAAFRAVDAGKQVAILVPTTILAQQHHATFSERFDEFPVRVELLSRFRTKAQQTRTLEELARGTVDVVIGTHRLLSKDVLFKDLGLLVIDEEHRFGVRHKEKLRRLKAGVDTLAMTATPIPRTLQMALIGVRDMSLIATSPKDRLPIHSEITEFEPETIATAILREIDRGGQVFFVHNRVRTIEAMHRYLKKIVPQAEIAVAHGQMHEKSLEGVMLGFLNGIHNVLLCTSIIESGLDIPSANTIIINRADRFGLAQLYQIRGRVGRSSRRAYAYLLTPPPRRLKPDAIKRLRALEAHSDLGSGFGLAMRDLEIRGAGTMLGARQSGFIEQVGFDLYNRMLEEAVAELKGEELTALPDTRLEMDIEIYLPDDYIGDNAHKVEIYRRLADSRTLDNVEEIRDEITDRFGSPPNSVVNLFDATAVKILAATQEMEWVRIRQGMVQLHYAAERKLTRPEVESYRRATDRPLEFSLVGDPIISIDLGQINEHERLAYLRGVLGKL